jgi:hypothetical protein
LTNRAEPAEVCFRPVCREIKAACNNSSDLREKVASESWHLVDDIILVGLDVHKATVSVAIAEPGRGGEVRHVVVVANRPDHIGKLVERLDKGGRRLSFCYEAGP